MTCITFIVHLTDTNHSMAILPTEESGKIQRWIVFEEITFLRKASRSSSPVTKGEKGSWRDGKAVKNSCCSCKRPECNSQHPCHQAPQNCL